MSYDEDEDAAHAEYRDALEQTKKLPAQRPRGIKRRSSPRYMTKVQLERKLDRFAETLGRFMREAGVMTWCGTWRSGTAYHLNSVVQDKGQLWIGCATKPDGRPGKGSGWRLMAKETTR